MRALQKELIEAFYSPISVIERKGPYFNSELHYHQQLELIYIKEGTGKRIVGDNFDSFRPGDLFFVGPNLAHKWKTDEDFEVEFTLAKSHSIVAYFNPEVFSTGFYNLKESNKINFLINKTSRGIKVTGETRRIIGRKMEELVVKKGFEKIIGLLEILHLLSISDDLEYLVYEGYEGKILQGISHRLNEVYAYVNLNYSKDITLEEIARVAHFTPPAFCRFFKQKTNQSFFTYLNEVRISHSCKFLTETGYNISEIAFLCGYKTLSNFNKFFKKSTGVCPTLYKEKALA